MTRQRSKTSITPKLPNRYKKLFYYYNGENMCLNTELFFLISRSVPPRGFKKEKGSKITIS